MQKRWRGKFGASSKGDEGNSLRKKAKNGGRKWKWLTETHETYLREWKKGKYALIVQEEGARSTG